MCKRERERERVKWEEGGEEEGEMEEREREETLRERDLPPFSL